MRAESSLAAVERGARLGGAILLALVLSAPAVLADDPLDDTDGTEGWDQVVQPAEKKPPQENQEQAFKREIASWEAIRQMWEFERSRYLNERATHKRLATRLLQRGKTSSTVIDDSNVDQRTLGDEWGDAPGEQWLVPSGAVDRAIDDELSESRPPSPKPRPAPAPAPAPLPPPRPATAILPPDEQAGETMPSAFTRHQGREEESGGIAPTSGDPDAALPPPPPQKKAGADDGARAAAEMLRKQQQDEERRQAEEKAREEREAAEGAAAAAQLLKQQEEEARKEQERLRQKANLETDDEGQVVDPDLKREIEEDED